MQMNQHGCITNYISFSCSDIPKVTVTLLSECSRNPLNMVLGQFFLKRCRVTPRNEFSNLVILGAL